MKLDRHTIDRIMAATDDITGVVVCDGRPYLKWAIESLGVIVHHPLRLGSMPGKEERGVFCEQNIPAESIVVSVPWEVRSTARFVISQDGTVILNTYYSSVWSTAHQHNCSSDLTRVSRSAHGCF